MKKLVVLMLACLMPSLANPVAAAEKLPLFYFFKGETDYAPDKDLFTWDGEGWIGGDIQRVWLKSKEGEVRDGTVEEAEIQALYSHNVSTFWDLQAGFRYDVVPRGLGHAVVGFQGLAPYFFETDAALFLSEDGDVSARLDQTFDVLLTQRFIAQPHFKLNLYAQDVPERHVGAGITEIETGIQWRYEITRKFAPYLDMVYVRRFGETAAIARRIGEDVDELTFRLGLRFFFN